MPTWNLVFDIDFTLTGDPPSLRKLGQKLQRLQQVGQARVLFCTGRPYPDVLHGLKHEELPQPDAIIAQTGVELYLPPFGSFRHHFSIGNYNLRSLASLRRKFISD